MADNIDPDPGQNKNYKKTRLLERATKFFKRVFGIKSHASFEESVSELIREHDEDNSVHEEEKTILQNIITFGELEGGDIMLPRTDIIAVPANIRLEDLKQVFLKHGHSRIPIFNGSIDHIIGFVHLKDFFRNIVSKDRYNLKEITRELIFVPSTIKVPDLLTRMKNSSVHIAIVLDEYGGTDGLLTIEDIVEEVLGEIKDEYDDEEPDNSIRQEEDGIVIDAKARVSEVGKALKIKFPEDNVEFDTLGGFIITYLGRIPLKGEKFSHPLGLTMEITDADNRKIKFVKILNRKDEA